MGRSYSKEGGHGDAVAALERALHIARVNEGLHNIRHARIVELIIDENLELRDWDALDRNYQFLYWLYRRNYGSEGPRVLPFLEQFARRRFEAFQQDAGSSALNHLIRADDLYDDAIDILDRDEAAHDARLINALYQRAVINYYIADTVSDTRFPFIAVREAMLENDRPVLEKDQLQTRARIAQDSFFKGELALKRIRRMTEANLARDPVTHAETLAFEGDYYLLFRRQWDAMRRYSAAWEVLREYHVAAGEIDRIFGTPRPLANLKAPFVVPEREAGREHPTLSFRAERRTRRASGSPVLPDGKAQPDSAETDSAEGDSVDADIYAGRDFVDAVFDVPASGWPANIRIAGTSAGDKPNLSHRGELAVAAVRYRPRFENGEPVDTRDVTLRYVFKSAGPAPYEVKYVERKKDTLLQIPD